MSRLTLIRRTLDWSQTYMNIGRTRGSGPGSKSGSLHIVRFPDPEHNLGHDERPQKVQSMHDIYVGISGVMERRWKKKKNEWP